MINNVMNTEGKFNYTGISDRLVRFIEEIQLKNTDLWKLVCSQFSKYADIHDNGWRGEYWGKLMRGACMVYEYTRSEELYSVLDKTVGDMLKNADEQGRFSTYSISTEFNGWDMWSRKYIMLGFLHFYKICRCEEEKQVIIEALKKHLDYIIDHIGSGEGKIEITDTSSIWQGINSSSILEPVVMLYNITGERRYFDFADYIVKNGGAKECDIFELAYENKLLPHEYPVVKAYEMMSCFEGLIEYYRVTEEEKYLTAAENFVQRIIDSEITIIGCAGCLHECFNNSVLMQTNTKYDGLMQETCVTVTWMKLCFKLLQLTGKSKYADEIEKSAYNALFGAVNTEGSRCTEKTTYDLPWYTDVYKRYSEQTKDINNGAQPFDSYSPLRADIRGRAIGGFKAMSGNTEYCGCCIAIGAAGLGLFPSAGVMKTENGAAFEFYMNGKAEIDDMSFDIQTSYPHDGYVKITVCFDAQKEILFRIPAFARDSSLSVNGVQISGVCAGQYACVSREWKNGDTVEIDIDMNPRLVRGLDNPEDEQSKNHIAVLYGPLVLARDARIGKVGEVLSYKKGELSLTRTSDVKFDTICEFDAAIDGQIIKMIDYASAGKTWDEASLTEAWIRIKE